MGAKLYNRKERLGLHLLIPWLYALCLVFSQTPVKQLEKFSVFLMESITVLKCRFYYY